MKNKVLSFCCSFISLGVFAQNVGINVQNPDVNLTILKDIRLDAENANNGTITNSLRFGSNPSGEYIFSKRTPNGNQFGLDFVTGSFSRLSIANNGNVGVGVLEPNFKLSVSKSIQLDAEDANIGGRENSLLFGVNNTGEYISSKRTIGGNQNGFDFFTSNVSRLTIGNNGNVAIGSGPISPTAKLQIYKTGNYTQFESTNSHALEIRDTSLANKHVLYMGADASSNMGYIQAAANTGSYNLLLQGRRGDVYVGKDEQSNLLVNGSVVIDNTFDNNGTLNYGLRFGAPGSGEGIASNRNNNVNQFGLDFYTGNSVKMTLGLDGILKVDNKEVLVTEMASSLSKQVLKRYTASLVGTNLLSGTQISSLFGPYTFKDINAAWLAGYTTISGDCNRVAVTAEIINTGSNTFNIRLYATNTSNNTISFVGRWNLMVLGGY